jgi:WD40 repeat protein
MVNLLGIRAWPILTSLPIQSARVWTVDSHRDVSEVGSFVQLVHACVSREHVWHRRINRMLAFLLIQHVVLLRVQGKELELKDHTQSVEGLCWHPKQADVLSTVSTDKNVRIWDIRCECSCASVESDRNHRNSSFSAYSCPCRTRDFQLSAPL